MGLVVKKSKQRFITIIIVSLVLLPSLVILAREVTPPFQHRNRIAENVFLGNSSTKSAFRESPKVHSLVLQGVDKPVIQDVQINEVSDTSANIEWDTNIPSTSEVSYDTTIPPSTWIVDTELVTYHLMTLTGLAPETTYYVQVRSTSDQGKKTTDNNNGDYYEFTTVSPPVTTTPVTTTPVTTTPVTTTPLPPFSTTLLFTSNSWATATGTVEIDRIYTTRVRFVDTDHGDAPINDAVITFSGDTNKVGVTATNSDNGIYRIEIQPTGFGSHTITITAVKTQFNRASATLFLEVNPIETDLYFFSNYQAIELKMIQVNKTYTTMVQFNRTSTTPETPIDNATINIVPSNSGVSYNITTLGNGRYQIAFRVNHTEQTSINIEASKTWYESNSATLVLLSGRAKTQLRFLSTLKSTETGTVRVYDRYTTLVQFNTTVISPEIPIDTGTIEVRSSSPNISYTVIPLGGGLYQIELEPTATGQITLDLEASAGVGYQDSFASLTLLVEPIPTTLELMFPELVNNRLPFTYSKPIEIVVRYADEKGGLNFETFEYETAGLVFQSYRGGNTTGEYIFSFEAPAPDTYQVILTLSKTNYAVATLTTTVMVNPIPIRNSQDPIVVITETDPKKLTITLINEVDEAPLTGAKVTYWWVDENVNGTMEDLGNGIYMVDLSNQDLPVGSYTFKILIEKTNHASLVLDYSLIVQEARSPVIKFLEQNLLYIILAGSVVIGGTTHYITTERRKQREWKLLETQKRKNLEFITDISQFNELMVITPGGIPFYSFTQSMNRSTQGIDSSLYSSFLMAIRTFAGETLTPENSINKEDHFRFGSTEIFLYTIRELVFAYMFTAQVQKGEWKEVSHEVLDRCRRLTIQIEREFQEVIKNFETFSDTTKIPASKISAMLIEALSLDFMSPHRIINLAAHNKIGLSGENDIIQTLKQLSGENGNVSLPQIIGRLEATGIPPDNIVFVFDQLREETAIIPVARIKQRESDEASSAEQEGIEQRPASISRELPEKQEIVLLDPEEKRELLKKLRALEDSGSKDENRDS